MQCESIEPGHLIDFKNCLARELGSLYGFNQQGLATLSDSGLEVTATGAYSARAIAMVFDKNLQVDQNRARFSKII